MGIGYLRRPDCKPKCTKITFLRPGAPYLCIDTWNFTRTLVNLEIFVFSVRPNRQSSSKGVIYQSYSSIDVVFNRRVSSIPISLLLKRFISSKVVYNQKKLVLGQRLSVLKLIIAITTAAFIYNF